MLSADFTVTYETEIIALMCCAVAGDVDSEIEEEKKKQQELDTQIREMEKKLREKQTKSDGKRGGSGGSGGGSGSGSAGKKGSGAKTTNQRHARKLEDQLQLVQYLPPILLNAGGGIMFSTCPFVCACIRACHSLLTCMQSSSLLVDLSRWRL